LQTFIFSDQPDRYWQGYVQAGIDPSSAVQGSTFTVEIEVPDGVAYAIEPKEINAGTNRYVSLTNNGSEPVYP